MVDKNDRDESGLFFFLNFHLLILPNYYPSLVQLLKKKKVGGGGHCGVNFVRIQSDVMNIQGCDMNTSEECWSVDVVYSSASFFSTPCYL